MSRTAALRVVTFNAWALPVAIPSQQKRRRLRLLPEALQALAADVIVLSEMFDVGARRRLVQALCPPYSTTRNAIASRRIFGVVRIDTTGGLLVLSRLPITASCFLPHQVGLGRKPDERVGRKGAMIVHLQSAAGPLTVAAVHLYAGTRPHHHGIRTLQLTQILEAITREASERPVVLAGDINASPTARYPKPPSPTNPLTPEYRTLMDAGFVDPIPLDSAPREAATWVPSRNRFAALPYQETKTDQRYDYVLVRPGAGLSWDTLDARTVIDGPDVYLSDHLGVQVDLQLIRDSGPLVTAC